MSDDAQQTICLDQFLKVNALAETGGHAKILIQSGEVLVNGDVETRRRRKLRCADRVELYDQAFVVDADDDGNFFAREA